MRRLASSLFALFLFLPLTAQAAPEIGKPAPDFTATAVDDALVKLSDFKGHIVVLEWTNPDCPFVRKHYIAGNMQQLQSDATRNDVVWLAINSSASGKEGHLTKMQARDYIGTNSVTASHYILDETGELGRLYGAKATPHMFVINKDGTLAYKGAIDDQPTPSKSSVSNAKNYVRAAIDELKHGKPVTTSSTQAYGCSVKYAD